VSKPDWPTREHDIPERLVPEQTDELPAVDPYAYTPPARRSSGFGLGMLFGIVLVALVAAAIAAAWLLTREDSEPAAKASSAPTPTQPAPPPPPAKATKTTVPRVVGYKQTRALVVLAEAHLKPKIVHRQTRQPVGTVLSQRPKEGTEVARNSRVRMVVDAPPPPKPLPDLTGRPYADAVALLRAQGLVPRKTTVTTDAKPGTIVDQAPKAGAKLKKGATVVLSVAKAPPAQTTMQTTTTQATTTTATTPTTTAKKPPPTTTASGAKLLPPPTGSTSMPDLVGQNQRQAWPTLVQAGIIPSVVYVPSQEPVNVIVAQAKQSGTTLNKGSHVQVNVSAGPDAQVDATVPNVLGKDPRSARQTLEGAGFTVQALSWPARATSQIGRVMEQQPLRGARVPSGAQITIFVGRGA
jgi:beta-lactam-binding protein with PASTA domain